MENHENNEKNNFQVRKEWTDKLKDLAENYPEDVDFLIIARAEVENNTNVNVIGAGGSPSGIMGSVWIAMDKSDQIKNILRGALLAERFTPPNFFDFMKKNSHS